MRLAGKRARVSPALLVAVVALVASLGGGAVAGVTVSALNKKEKKQVKRISKKQAKKQVKKIPAGPRGPKGDFGQQGPKGDAGESAASYWAVVAEFGSLVRGSPGASSAQLFKPAVDGSYEVDFGRDVSECSLLATLGRTDAEDFEPQGGEISTAYRVGNAEAVFVKARNSDGTKADRSFHLAVLC